jgi:hypothetical protein
MVSMLDELKERNILKSIGFVRFVGATLDVGDPILALLSMLLWDSDPPGQAQREVVPRLGVSRIRRAYNIYLVLHGPSQLSSHSTVNTRNFSAHSRSLIGSYLPPGGSSRFLLR